MITLQKMKDNLGHHKSVKFIEQEVDGVSVTVVCYMINDPSIWKLPYGLEARGATFLTSTGECICRPFEKFFNLGETESLQEKDIEEKYNSSASVAVYEKVDGSMITAVLINNKIFFKSKKSFYSDVAKEANLCLTPALDKFCKQELIRGIQPIFEFTSPNNQVVINYGDKPKFTLLALREIESGYYTETLPILDFVDNIDQYSFSSLTAIKQTLLNLNQKEGYVVVIDNLRFKMKTQWYMERHGVLELRERDVADAVLNESLDDIKSRLVELGVDCFIINSIEFRVIDELNGIQDEIERLAKRYQGTEMKEVALALQENALRGYVIGSLKGKELDIKKFWNLNYRGTYSLQSVINPKF